MITQFKQLVLNRDITAHLTTIRNFMNNAHTFMDSGTISKDKFKEKLKMICYPLTLSFIEDYEKDMVPFDVRWAINDVETNAFQAQNSIYWPPKVLDLVHNIRLFLPVAIYSEISDETDDSTGQQHNHYKATTTTTAYWTLGFLLCYHHHHQ